MQQKQKFTDAIFIVIEERSCPFYNIGDELKVENNNVVVPEAKQLCMVLVSKLIEITAKKQSVERVSQLGVKMSQFDCGGCQGKISFEYKKEKSFATLQMKLLFDTDASQEEVSTFKFPFRKSPAAFQGDLSVITIENLMQLVGYAALSGELLLTTPSNTAVFFVHEGTLVFSYLEKNPMKIGERLVQDNYITSENLQECLAQYRRTSSRPKIGEILLEKGYLQQKDLEKVIKEQIKAIFFEVLSWREGSFSFSIKEIPQGEDIFLEERIDHLILEGIVHLDNLA
jgi:hypothetical protein